MHKKGQSTVVYWLYKHLSLLKSMGWKCLLETEQMWSLRVVLVQSLELQSAICIIAPIPVTIRYLCCSGGGFIEGLKEELQNLLLLPSRFPVSRARAYYLGQAHRDAHFSQGVMVCVHYMQICWSINLLGINIISIGALR